MPPKKSKLAPTVKQIAAGKGKFMPGNLTKNMAEEFSKRVNLTTVDSKGKKLDVDAMKRNIVEWKKSSEEAERSFESYLAEIFNREPRDTKVVTFSDSPPLSIVSSTVRSVPGEAPETPRSIASTSSQGGSSEISSAASSKDKEPPEPAPLASSKDKEPLEGIPGVELLSELGADALLKSVDGVVNGKPMSGTITQKARVRESIIPTPINSMFHRQSRNRMAQFNRANLYYPYQYAPRLHGKAFLSKNKYAHYE
jgi:hypothetical protein